MLHNLLGCCGSSLECFCSKFFLECYSDVHSLKCSDDQPPGLFCKSIVTLSFLSQIFKALPCCCWRILPIKTVPCHFLLVCQSFPAQTMAKLWLAYSHGLYKHSTNLFIFFFVWPLIAFAGSFKMQHIPSQSPVLSNVGNFSWGIMCFTFVLGRSLKLSLIYWVKWVGRRAIGISSWCLGTIGC